MGFWNLFGKMVRPPADTAELDAVSSILRAEPGRDPYREQLAYQRRTRSPETIANGSASLATVLMSELFKFAADEALPVALFSGDLHSAVYTPLIDDLEPFLATWTKDAPAIRVLVERMPDPPGINPFYNRLMAAAGKAQVLKVAPSGNVPKPHFMLVGTEAYRAETNHGSRKAVGCFNDAGKVVTPLLQARFNAAWDAALARNEA